MDAFLCSSEGGEPLSNEFKLSELKDIADQAKSIGVYEIFSFWGRTINIPIYLRYCEYIEIWASIFLLYTCGISLIVIILYRLYPKIFYQLKE